MSRRNIDDINDLLDTGDNKISDVPAIYASNNEVNKEYEMMKNILFKTEGESNKHLKKAKSEDYLFQKDAIDVYQKQQVSLDTLECTNFKINKANGQIKNKETYFISDAEQIMKNDLIFKRVRLTYEQANALYKEYAKNMYPRKEDYLRMHNSMNVPIKNLKIWFRNQRAKTRARSENISRVKFMKGKTTCPFCRNEFLEG